MNQYLSPKTLSEALELLDRNQGKARVLAGGTDLMPDIQAGVLDPEIIIDINNIPELQGIEIGTTQVVIGAAVPFAVIKTHPFLKAHVPVLTEAASSIGAGGIQQSATWAGNIVQAMPAADGAIAAIALEAQALVCSSQEQDWQEIKDLYLGPKESTIDPARQIITAIRFPIPPPNQLWGNAWKRLGRRSALVLPIVNCAVNLLLAEDQGSKTISKALIAIGPADAVPFLAERGAQYLVGQPPDQVCFARAGELASEEARPRSSPLRASEEYRHQIIPVLVRDALSQAAQNSHPLPER